MTIVLLLATPGVGVGVGGGGMRQEYCTMEYFNASCPPGELIVMQSAIYGRMRLGRCVHLNYGHLGCSVNVRSHLDVRCSGRNVCRILLPDPVLFRLRPCPGDLSSYLEASYTCLEGMHTCLNAMLFANYCCIRVCVSTTIACLPGSYSTVCK